MEITAHLDRQHPFPVVLAQGKCFGYRGEGTVQSSSSCPPSRQRPRHSFSDALVPLNCQWQSGSAPLHPAYVIVLAHVCVHTGKKCMGPSSMWDCYTCVFSFSLKKKVKEF